VKLVHLVGFIIKKFVTIHGHMNVKFMKVCLCHWNIVLPIFRYDLPTDQM